MRLAKKINIKGDIISSGDKWIYEWLGMEATCPKDVQKALEDANGQDVEVDINSGGGNVFAGSEIYTALRSYKGNLVINIVGVAASAASVIAMAGKNQITPTGLFMIHNACIRADGDYHEMDHTSEVLKIVDQSIVNAYKAKTGLPDKALFQLMDKTTWMSAEEAVKNKFIDKVMFDAPNQAPPVYNNFGGIPPEAIAKIKNQVKKPDVENNGPDFLLQTKLNFLKLRGDMKDE